MDASRTSLVPRWKLIAWAAGVVLVVGATAVAASVGALLLSVFLTVCLIAALLGRGLFGGKGKAANHLSN